MIGITKTSSGRLGNRLFHYHLLRQLAAKAEIGYFHPRLSESRYFEEMDKVPRPFKLLRRDVKLESGELLAMGQEKAIPFIQQSDKDIVLVPPMLGEVFFDFLFFPPSRFIKIKEKYQAPFPFPSQGKNLVALHFRGTDFEAWNSQASLKFPYYKRAINACREFFPAPVFILFTDDPEFPAYRESLEYLKNEKLEFHLSRNLDQPIADFYQLSQCEAIISSPSTFAILAGAIGRENKKIIHDKGWLDYSLARNDAFWVKLSTASNPYYSLWQAL